MQMVDMFYDQLEDAKQRKVPFVIQMCIRDREYRVYDSKQAFIGIYRYDAEEAYFRLVKMFYDGQAG